VLKNAFKIKKTRLKLFFKELIHHLKGVLKGSLAFMQHFKFENWRIGGLYF
jgi:hypothetical protein